MANRTSLMREFAFTVRFERGADRLMDVFLDEPRLSTRTQACFADEWSMWRVDAIHGPSEALERVDEHYLDESTCNECLDVERCESAREHVVVDRGPDHRIVYTRRHDIVGCHSIPTLAVREIGDGLLFEARRRGDAYTWLVLMPGDAPVGRLYDRVRAHLRDGLSLELGHVSEAEHASFLSPDRVLSAEERLTLEAAVDAGYYGTPRGTTVSDLAEDLGVPRSTVQHRLQRAEAAVVEEFVAAPG
jgi:hypothetical protein